MHHVKHTLCNLLQIPMHLIVYTLLYIPYIPNYIPMYLIIYTLHT